MAECTELTVFGGTLPNNGQTDEQNIVSCTNFMNWLVNDFTQEFNGVFPKICAAANAGAMYLFKGEWGADGVPTVFDAGWVVLKDGVYYASNVNNNSDVPPSSKWSALEQFVPLSGGTMTGTLIVPKLRKTTSGGNGFQLNENQLFLWAKYATSDESKMLFDMSDNASIFVMRPYKGGNAQTEIRFNFNEDKWYLGNTVIGGADWDSGWLTPADGGEALLIQHNLDVIPSRSTLLIKNLDTGTYRISGGSEIIYDGAYFGMSISRVTETDVSVFSGDSGIIKGRFIANYDGSTREDYTDNVEIKVLLWK